MLLAFNVAVGNYAMGDGATSYDCSNNVAIGHEAADQLRSINNVAIGQGLG